MIQCPNYSCQAINAEAHQFCHQCQAPVPRRFLWAVGHRAEDFNPGTVISDRYLCKARQVFLDLKPGLPPGTLSEIPFSVLPYLRLTPYRLNLPQVYGWADGTFESGDMTRLMFLENSALHPSSQGVDAESPVLPSLQEVWSSGSAFQQLHWLWQIARLWHPLATEHIASSLLEPALIRVEASLIRLLQLHVPQPNADEASQPQLQQLGRWWEVLATASKPDIRPFLRQLCQKMATGYFADGQALVTALDLGLKAVGKSYTFELGIATQTDKGPSRANNQDACSPSSGSVVHTTFTPGAEDTPHSSLMVVCDGIGGHQGGEIASATAIEEITHTLQTLELPTSTEGLNPWMVHDHLNVAIAQANDAINQRNDEEKRRERARMGTTVVMGLLHDYECYLSHVGDSRVYWITSAGCHQVTLDDDVASREARLAYGTYRSVLYHPNAGALVQALGMGPSKNLYPSGQRILLGEEGVLLFCSDGLSDQDLIEICWDSVLSPLFQSTDQDDASSTLGRVAQDLIDLANTRNGHDNVTIGLIQWNARQSVTIEVPELDILIAAYNQRVEVGLSSANDPINTSPPTQERSLSARLDAASFAEEDGHEEQQRTAFAEVAEVNPGAVASTETVSAEDANSGVSNAGGASTLPDDTESLAPSGEEIAWISPSAKAQSSRRSPFFVVMMALVSLFGLLALAGGVVYFGIPEVGDRINSALGINPEPDSETPPSPLPSESVLDPALPGSTDDSSAPSSGGVSDMKEPLAIGHILNLRRTAPVPRTLSAPDDATDGERQDGVGEQALLLLFAQPPNAASLASQPQNQEGIVPESLEQASNPLGVVPWGSILQVQKTRPLPLPGQSSSSQPPGTENFPDTASHNSSNAVDVSPVDSVSQDGVPEAFVKSEGERWVQVQLCFTPDESSSALDGGDQTILAVGSKGWISERQLKELSYLDRGQASPFNEYCSLGP